MELTYIITVIIALVWASYVVCQNQKFINKHKEFLKSLENDLTVNLKGNLVVKGSDLERTLSRDKRVFAEKFPSKSN